MPILFDSSIYISALRNAGNTLPLLQRWARETPLWLSSVVLEELYAGEAPEGERAVKKLERDFDRVGRILVPTLTDWTQAGKVLASVARKYGYERIGRSRLTNDALIATSAARSGVTLFTTNVRDFARLAEFCALQWEVRSVS